MIDFFTPYINGITKVMLRRNIKSMLDPISGNMAYRMGDRVFELTFEQLRSRIGNVLELLFLAGYDSVHAIFRLVIISNQYQLIPVKFDMEPYIARHSSTLLIVQSPPDANVHHVAVPSVPSSYSPAIENYAFPYPYVPQTYGAKNPYVWDNGRISAGLEEGYIPVVTGRRHFKLSGGSLIQKYRTVIKNVNDNNYKIAYEVDGSHTIQSENIKSDGGKMNMAYNNLVLDLIASQTVDSKLWDQAPYGEGYDITYVKNHTTKIFETTPVSYDLDYDTPIDYQAVLGDKELYMINNVDLVSNQVLTYAGALFGRSDQTSTNDFHMVIMIPYQVLIVGHGGYTNYDYTYHDDFDHLTTTIEISDVTILYLDNTELDRFTLVKQDTSQILINESPPGTTWEVDSETNSWYNIHYPPPEEGWAWFGASNFNCKKTAATWIAGDYVTISIDYGSDTIQTYNLICTNATKNWQGEVFISNMDYDYMEDKYVYLCAYSEVDSTRETKHTSPWGVNVESESVACTEPMPAMSGPYSQEAFPEINNIKVRDILNDTTTYKWKLVYDIGQGVQKIILPNSYYYKKVRNYDERNFVRWSNDWATYIFPTPYETTDEEYKGERITGFSVQTNEDHLLYTYIVESTDVSLTSVTCGLDDEGNPVLGDEPSTLDPGWAFVKRIIGIINISNSLLPIGHRQEFDTTDEEYSFPDFIYNELAAIGYHIATV